jgi:hypothetical protein
VIGGGVCVLGSAVFRSDPAPRRAQAGHAPGRRALHHETAQNRHDAEEWRAAMEGGAIAGRRI